jgi:acyl-CoA reductase-like NAD-dependent aldehyde dehydrogenase
MVSILRLSITIFHHSLSLTPNPPRDLPTRSPELVFTSISHFYTAMAITTRSSCYDESVATIVRLPPEEWAQAGKAAVEKERARNQRGAEKLANQLSAAFEAAAKRHEGIAKILRKEIDLDPTSATVEFLIFRVLQFAQTFKKIVRICVRNG